MMSSRWTARTDFNAQGQTAISKKAKPGGEEQRRRPAADHFEDCSTFLDTNKVKQDSIRHISDEGVSGEVRDQPEIREIIRDIATRLIAFIVVEGSSRLSHGIDLCKSIFEPVIDNDIRIFCFNDIALPRFVITLRQTVGEDDHQAGQCQRSILYQACIAGVGRGLSPLDLSLYAEVESAFQYRYQDDFENHQHGYDRRTIAERGIWIGLIELLGILFQRMAPDSAVERSRRDGAVHGVAGLAASDGV